MKKNILVGGALGALTIFGLFAGQASAFYPQAKNLTDEEKSQLEELHTLVEEGNFEEADKLREELGLPTREEMQARHEEMRANHEAIKEAIENNDYESFKDLTKDAPFAENVNEEFFAKMVEMHELRQSGDYEAADLIRQELGLPDRGMGHQRHRFGSQDN
ncbi:hypothetical protein KC852_02270 [Candidatus Nomurabacteria bacterium]|nr:hypothetical protein [Candidatus Nomurabacteria bacterium]